MSSWIIENAKLIQSHSIVTVDNLAKSPEHIKKSFVLTLKNAAYTEDENGERIFKVDGSFILKNQGHGGRYWEHFVVTKSVKLITQVDNSNGEITTVFTAGGGSAKIGTIAGVSFNPVPLSQDFSFKVSGIKNLPDNTMTVKVILRGDNYGVSNVITVTRNLISSISDKVRLERESQNQKNQEITFNEQTNSGDFNETPITDISLDSGCSECSDPIEKELPNNNMKFAGIAGIGVIGLLLYTKGGLK